MPVSIMTGGIRLPFAAWTVNVLVTALCLASIGCIAESPGVLHLHGDDPTSDAPPVSTPDAGAPDATPGATPSTGETPPTAVDNGAMLTAIAEQYATSPAFKRVSRAPYPSKASSGIMIDTWVSAQAYDAYTRISPDSLGSKASTPPGTVIVRAVVNEKDDSVEKLTLMVK